MEGEKAALEFWQKYQLQLRLMNPSYRRHFQIVQQNEAVRLLENNLLKWDGDKSWEVYAGVYHVREQGGDFVCDCDIFSMLGYCSHVLAVEKKEGK